MFAQALDLTTGTSTWINVIDKTKTALMFLWWSSITSKWPSCLASFVSFKTQAQKNNLFWIKTTYTFLHAAFHLFKHSVTLSAVKFLESSTLLITEKRSYEYNELLTISTSPFGKASKSCCSSLWTCNTKGNSSWSVHNLVIWISFQHSWA